MGKVFSSEECDARQEVMLESYNTTPLAVATFNSAKAKAVFEAMKVFSSEECDARRCRHGDICCNAIFERRSRCHLYRCQKRDGHTQATLRQQTTRPGSGGIVPLRESETSNGRRACSSGQGRGVDPERSLPLPDL